MPYNLQIIRASDFVRLNGKGEYDQAETRLALTGIAKACVTSGIDCALLDTREARSDMQLNDLYELVLAFKEMGFQKNHRLAILHRSRSGARVEFFSLAPGELAKFFAMCATERGWNVKAFDDYEQAMQWLGATTPAE
jgi:hypothetical protein